MSEHAHNKCTDNSEKREGKSHVPEHALEKKKTPSSFYEHAQT